MQSLKERLCEARIKSLSGSVNDFPKTPEQLHTNNEENNETASPSMINLDNISGMSVFLFMVLL